MSTWIIVLIILILVIGGIAMFYVAAPAVTEFHRDSLAPIRGLVGNPDSAKALAMMI